MRPIFGIFLIYIVYCSAAMLQEKIITTPYLNTEKYQHNYFPYAIAFVLFPSIFSWLISFALNSGNNKKAQIPMVNSIKCGGLVFVSALCFTQALYHGNYPGVLMMKSFNIVPLALASYFIDKKSQGNSKIKALAGVLSLIVIAMFALGRPVNSPEKGINLINFSLILLSLIADGFLPLFQREVKEKSEYKGFEMMEQINKWKTLFCLIYLFASLESVSLVKFLYYNKKCFWHLIAFSILSSTGELIVYWLIRIFQGGVVPFVVSTRKMNSVLLSLVIFSHRLGLLQIIAVILAYAVTMIDFLKDITAKEEREKEDLRVMLNNVIEGQSFLHAYDQQQY